MRERNVDDSIYHMFSTISMLLFIGRWYEFTRHIIMEIWTVVLKRKGDFLLRRRKGNSSDVFKGWLFVGASFVSLWTPFFSVKRQRWVNELRKRENFVGYMSSCVRLNWTQAENYLLIHKYNGSCSFHYNIVAQFRERGYYFLVNFN